MIGNKWFCEPDPFREKYCFLYLDTTSLGKNQIIKGWKTGIGNIDSIVHYNQSTDKNEYHIIKDIIPEIRAWRKKNILVITDAEESLPILRTRIAAQKIDEIVLSTIKSLSLENLFKKYFSYQADANLQYWCDFLDINTHNIKEPELMRMLLHKIIRLIPCEVLP